MGFATKLIRRAQDLLRRSVLARYAAALALVLVTIGFRAAFESVFSTGVYFHLYYPAVILSAYLLGAWPGVFAIFASAVLAQWLFGAGATQQPPVALFTFIVSSGVAVFVLAHMRHQLRFLTSEYERIDALTQSQASLFREHAERVSNHMQLISALLQLQARDEAKPDLSRVLRNAASRTLLISRMHRTFARPEHETIDFKAFAARLADATMASRERPAIPVIIEGERVQVPLEQATSLGLLLIECFNARAARENRGVMRIALTQQGETGVFSVSDEGLDEHAAEPKMDFLAAIAEQLRGSLVIDRADDVRTLNLSFPTRLQALPEWKPLESVH
ncbi:MAG: histidine kinase dimerization/phosphoacceptor domain -containing protein [Hyphomonadaceae bacterium]